MPKGLFTTTMIVLSIILSSLTLGTILMGEKANRLEAKVSAVMEKVAAVEERLHGTCEPSLQYEKRCTRLQYLYKNGHFRGVKCLRWED